MSATTASNVTDRDRCSEDQSTDETVMVDSQSSQTAESISDMTKNDDAVASTKTLSDQMESIDLQTDAIVEQPSESNIDDGEDVKMGVVADTNLTAGSACITPVKCGDQTVEQVIDSPPRSAMLDRVAKSDAHFRHQQRGEPDLTFDEKREIATELLDRKPAIFLSRFGKHISSEDLDYFQPLRNDYVIDFHTKEIEKLHNDKKNRTVVRNRRYEAMKKLLEGGEYFGDDAMKHRDPLMYEQMVGQYRTEDEVAGEIDKSDLTFSSILMSHIQMQYDNVLYNRQMDIEEGQMEESDDDDSDLDEDFGVGRRQQPTEMKEDLSEPERQNLRDEFLQTMKIRFINGEDRDFTYSDVDYSVEYDPLDIRGHDEEENYFDQDDTESTQPAHADVEMHD